MNDTGWMRSERMLVEQLGYKLLLRGFVDISVHDDPWGHSTVSQNRDRLVEQNICEPKSNPEVDFRGKPRANDAHQSRTDPDYRLHRKSKTTEGAEHVRALQRNR